MPDEDDPYWRLRPRVVTPDHEICACNSATSIVLQPHFSPNPLSCARCNLEVPPERIGMNASVAESVARWRAFHEAFDVLWLDSGEFEDWAADQLSDPASAVNRRGLALARQLSEWRRCYLWWFQKTSQEGDETGACPCRALQLEPRFTGERPEGGGLLVCEACSLAIAV